MNQRSFALSCRTRVAHAEAVQLIVPLRGRQFDPDVLDAFLEIQDQFYAIARSY